MARGSLVFSYGALSLRLLSVFSEAGRGNHLHPHANIRQNNKHVVLRAENVNQLPSSFITLFFFLRGRKECCCSWLYFVMAAFSFVRLICVGCQTAQIADGVRYPATCQTSAEVARSD